MTSGTAISLKNSGIQFGQMKFHIVNLAVNGDERVGSGWTPG